MAGTDGEDGNGDGGWKGLLQTGIVIVSRYERQQESKVPWHMRFTPSWQFTLTDPSDHQRRRQQQALRLMTVRTDGPGSDVYMGKRLELTTEKLRAYPVGTSWYTGTNVWREPDDGRNVLKVDALVAGLRTSNVRSSNISGERRCGKGSYAGRLQEIDQKTAGRTRRTRKKPERGGTTARQIRDVIPDDTSRPCTEAANIRRRQHHARAPFNRSRVQGHGKNKKTRGETAVLFSNGEIFQTGIHRPTSRTGSEGTDTRRRDRIRIRQWDRPTAAATDSGVTRDASQDDRCDHDGCGYPHQSGGHGPGRVCEGRAKW
jgi:hypothetical protein